MAVIQLGCQRVSQCLGRDGLFTRHITKLKELIFLSKEQLSHTHTAPHSLSPKYFVQSFGSLRIIIQHLSLPYLEE